MATMDRAKVLRIAGLDDRLTDRQVLRNRQDERTLQLRFRRELVRRADDEAEAFYARASEMRDEGLKHWVRPPVRRAGSE
jgi:hypothetical protein